MFSDFLIMCAYVISSTLQSLWFIVRMEKLMKMDYLLSSGKTKY